MKRVARLLAAFAAALLLLWLLSPKRDEEAVRRIEGRARSDLVEACNQAAAEAGLDIRFTLADVAAPRREAIEAASGVALLASVLQASRDGALCAWNGIDAATITQGN
jgi:hypothetical protein